MGEADQRPVELWLPRRVAASRFIPSLNANPVAASPEYCGVRSRAGEMALDKI